MPYYSVFHALASFYARAKSELKITPPPSRNIGAFKLSKAAAKEQASKTPGPCEQIFFSKKGRPVHKWIHYLEIYDKLFASYRGRPVKFLEIGISLGGSIEMWREYFGPQSEILGIDVNPVCEHRVDPPNKAVIGSQADEAVLEKALWELGTPDIILDDGSHIAHHQIATFKYLFPHLADGGLYLIEDCHTAYWLEFGGAYGRSDNAIGLAKTLIDDIHGWYHKAGPKYCSADEVRSVSIYDSIVSIEKRKEPRPGHAIFGGDEA